MGIEQAAARVREIQAMTQGVAASSVGATSASPTSTASASPSQAAAFTSQLQAQLLMGGASPTTPGLGGASGQVGLGGLPVIPAELLGAQGVGGVGGSGALGVQAMLAGMQPAAMASGPSRLSGDLDGMNAELRRGLEQVAAAIGKDLEVISGHRTHQEQAALYQKYLNGTGNLAAPPGHSNHESGDAADVYVNGVALQNVPGAAEAAKAAGLGFPVGGEPWHVEHLH